MSVAPPTPIEVFISYSHNDEELKRELTKHLSLLNREHLISEWHDRDITAGTEWRLEIDRHLNTARLILILVSPDYMASEYCYGIEMTRALQRHYNGSAVVIRSFCVLSIGTVHLLLNFKPYQPMLNRSRLG